VTAERIRQHLLKPGRTENFTQPPVLSSEISMPNYSNGIKAQIWETNRISSIRIAIAEGKSRDAHVLLDPLLDFTTLKGQNRYGRTAYVLRALAHDMDGNTIAANEAMINALECCMAPRAIRPFLDEGPRVVTILERLHDRFQRQLTGRSNRAVQAQIARILAAIHPPAGMRTLPSREDRDGAAQTEPSLLEPLKVREIEVLRLVSEGNSNKEIARYLEIGVDTVKWYLKAIYGKMNVSRRTQAISEARRLKLID
jgi:ATP/maltotriose-dependent transcriptional regulator MalT